MKRIITTATLLALSGAWTAAHADNERGFYAGGGLGRFNAQIDDIDQTDDAIERLDDDDAAWKLFVGYRFNPYIAIEGAYVDFGGPSDEFEADDTGDSKYSLSFSGFAPYVIGTLPVGPVEIFAKAGYYFYDVKWNFDFDGLNSDTFDAEDSDEDFLYGVGVGMTFLEHLHARLEYERVDSSVLDDADALWLSAAWRF